MQTKTVAWLLALSVTATLGACGGPQEGDTSGEDNGSPTSEESQPSPTSEGGEGGEGGEGD